MMDERKPMLDQTASPLERALLQEGRTYRASSDLHDRTLAALGISSSAGIVGGVLAWLAAKSLTTKVILALSTMTLLAAIPLGYVLLGKHTSAALSSPVVLLAPAAQTSPALAAPSVSAPSPASQPPAPVKPATSASANTGAALRAELAALDAVRSALANDNPTGALSLVATYFHAFPRGRLYPEAEVLRIDALARAGQQSLAKRHANEFIKRHPNSVLTPRVRPYADR
jgi:predicted component of type VI protein secretion system